MFEFTEPGEVFVMRTPPALLCAVMLAACAADVPPEPMKPRVITKVVERIVPGPTITVEKIVPGPVRVERVTVPPEMVGGMSPPFCPAERKTLRCDQFASCAEAYHYYDQCNRRDLSGGAGYPDDGIPCKATLCGMSSALMQEKICLAPTFIYGGKVYEGAKPVACR